MTCYCGAAIRFEHGPAPVIAVILPLQLLQMFSYRLFQPTPDRGQLAIDGEWEKALLFSRGEMQTPSDIRAYLDGRNEIAFEAFFKNAFFGFRRIGDAEYLSQLVAQCSQALANANSGKHFFETIGQITELPLGATLQFAEIGAVNAWRSVGPFSIKDPADALSSFDSVYNQLLDSAVAQNTTHPKAIEFAFDSGDKTNHWFAIPVSSDSSPYKIQKEKLREALSLI